MPELTLEPSDLPLHAFTCVRLMFGLCLMYIEVAACVTAGTQCRSWRQIRVLQDCLCHLFVLFWCTLWLVHGQCAGLFLHVQLYDNAFFVNMQWLGQYYQG